MPADSFWTFLAASSVSGVCVCIAMQPPDTVRPAFQRGNIARVFFLQLTHMKSLFFFLHHLVPRLLQGCTIVSPTIPPLFLSKNTEKSSCEMIWIIVVENTIKDPITGKVRGALYTNPFDCLWKTFKAEGIAGWYKGD